MWSATLVHPVVAKHCRVPFALPYVCAGSTFLGATGLTVTRWPSNARPFNSWRANRVIAGYIVIHLHVLRTMKNAVLARRKLGNAKPLGKVCWQRLCRVALWSSCFTNRFKASEYDIYNENNLLCYCMFKLYVIYMN